MKREKCEVRNAESEKRDKEIGGWGDGVTQRRRERF
jgi:hypothetical protein